MITLVATLIMNILAITGMLSCYRKFNGAWLLIILFISFSLAYSLTHAYISYRYRLPLDPYLLMFAAVALNTVYVKFSPFLGTVKLFV